jgi:hypothetical protein
MAERVPSIRHAAQSANPAREGAADAARTRVTWSLRLKRIGLVLLMAVLTTNVWTGSPLFALWVGSRVQGTGPPSMAAIATVAVTLGLVSLLLVWVLAGLERTYNRLVGQRPGVRRHVAWLRSLRGERPYEQGIHGTLSPLEIILVMSVVVAVLAFEIWFFFSSGSPISSTAGTSSN